MARLNLYGFWSYSHFPYILGGPIQKISDKGLIETSNYGKGYWFKPILIVPLEAGRKIQAELDNLLVAFNKADKEFKNTWNAKASGLLKKITGKHK